MAKLASRNLIPITSSNTNNHSRQNKEQMYGVPVKFAHDLFTTLIKDQVNEFINLPKVKQLHYTDENAIREVTYELIELLKPIVYQNTKDNYKVIIQVVTYPKEDEKKVFIMSQCLWNYRTDDVFSLEIENDLLKFLIVIHGLVA